MRTIDVVGPEAMAHLGERDPVMAGLIARLGPPRIEPHTRYFHALLSAIVGQQISVHAARSIRGRLAALVPGGELSAAAILALSAEDLRSAGLSRPKMAYVVDLAQRVATGDVDLDAIARMPDEQVVEHLTLIKGIGRWTAEMFLIFCLGRPDVLPVDDLGFREAARRAYSLPERPKAPHLIELGERWRPYRTLATWYLWRSLENTPVTGALV